MNFGVDSGGAVNKRRKNGSRSPFRPRVEKRRRSTDGSCYHSIIAQFGDFVNRLCKIYVK